MAEETVTQSAEKSRHTITLLQHHHHIKTTKELIRTKEYLSRLAARDETDAEKRNMGLNVPRPCL